MNLPTRMPGLTKCLTMATLLIGVNVQSAQAAGVYVSQVVYRPQGIQQGVLVTGTTYAYADVNNSPFPGANIVNDFSEASIVNNQITLRGYNPNDIYAAWSLASSSSVTFNDLIFTDTSNPGSGGSISAQVNYYTNTSAFGGLSSGIEIGSAYAVITDGPNGSYSFNATVPLNTPVTLTFDLSLIPTVGGAVREASMGLSSIPFTLAPGFTVNSVAGGIVNNTISPVPVPAAVWLFGSALIGLAGVAKRRKSWNIVRGRHPAVPAMHSEVVLR